MGNKLTSVKNAKNNGILTTNTNCKFKIQFGDKLLNQYNFSILEKNNSHKLIRFLDRIVGKNWNEVDRTYKRSTDNQDVVDGREIIHYGPGGIHTKLRLHGFIEGDVFIVVRIDPNHSFHQ